MKTNIFLLLFLCLFFTASCTDNEDLEPEPKPVPETEFVQSEKDNYEIAAEGGNVDINIETNISKEELKIYATNADWLMDPQPETRTVNSYVLKLVASANTNVSSRTASIYFVQETDAGKNYLDTVTVTQVGIPPGTSTDDTADKSVRTLQIHTSGQGIPIVMMGDGFIDKEIAAGTYDKVMDKALENLFTEEPMKSLRDYFDVYAVTAVSKNNSFEDGYETAFGCKLKGGNSTLITIDKNGENKVMEYANINGVDPSEILAVVILNTSDYAGTTSFAYTNRFTQEYVEFAIAYCPVIDNLDSERFRRVLVHEAVGHGFAKLEDEYSYGGTIPSEEKTSVRKLQKIGWAQNVDFTNNRSEVLWSAFLDDNRYTSDDLGIFEGACTYMKGVYRPSSESMMNGNIQGFNAPSRKAIYDRTMKTGLKKTATYEEFVIYDLQHRPTQTRSSSTLVPDKPFARPHIANKPLMSK